MIKRVSTIQGGAGFRNHPLYDSHWCSVRSGNLRGSQEPFPAKTLEVAAPFLAAGKHGYGTFRSHTQDIHRMLTFITGLWFESI